MVNISLTGDEVDRVSIVAIKSPVRRIGAALDELLAADGPLSRLDAARRLREAADDLEANEVQMARKAGATWIEIAACYGLTKQGAQQRFRTTHRKAKAAPPGEKGRKPSP